jgi:hypothetical protein
LKRDVRDFADWGHGRDACVIVTSQECVVNDLGKHWLAEVVDNRK